MSEAVLANDRSAHETGALPTGSASHTAAMALLVCVAYFIAAEIGLALTLHPHPVSTLWPPNALLLALLLLTPTTSWWVVLLAALPAHLVVELRAGIPLTMAGSSATRPVRSAPIAHISPSAPTRSRGCSRRCSGSKQSWRHWSTHLRRADQRWGAALAPVERGRNLRM